MGAFVDSLFNILMSWVRALVSGIWALFSDERMTVLEFLGKNWIAIAVLMIAAGLVLDWIIWLIRWQPYHIWAKRVRRLLRMADPEDEEEYSEAAYMPPEETVYAPQEPSAQEQEDMWLPLRQPELDEVQVQQVMETAENTPDEYQYPGMRFDDTRTVKPVQPMDGTRRYAAVHTEGPGAAEVTRRRAEIDAWQLQMQEEARQKAEAERAARLAEAERERRAAQEAYEAEQARLAQEAYEAEQARLAQEAYEAEQARLAQEAYEAEQARLAQEAYEAEQARLAQEEYERQLAEYERQKAQYERDLAEYERQKAEYEAELARQALLEEEARLAQEAEQQLHETAEEIAPAASARRRRRSAAYSDYVPGEDVTELPDAPQWKPMQQMPQADTGAEKSASKPEKKSIWRSGVEKMAQMMEPEENDVTGIAALPPRVDRHKAYKPAKKPEKRTGKK